MTEDELLEKISKAMEVPLEMMTTGSGTSGNPYAISSGTSTNIAWDTGLNVTVDAPTREEFDELKAKVAECLAEIAVLRKRLGDEDE